MAFAMSPLICSFLLMIVSELAVFKLAVGRVKLTIVANTCTSLGRSTFLSAEKAATPMFLASLVPMSTYSGIKLPRSKSLTASKPPSLNKYISAGLASATCTSFMSPSSLLRRGFANPSAALSAPKISVWRCVTVARSSASRNRPRSDVNDCNTSGRSLKVTNMALSVSFIASILSPIRRFADSNRFSSSSTSVANMLADESSKKTLRSCDACSPWCPGRNSAKAANNTAANCKSNKRLRLSRCIKLLTCKSSIVRDQRYVLGTSTGSRRSFKKYSSTMPTGIAPSNAH